MWDEIVEGWASVYVGYPNVIHLDQDSSFKLNYLRSSADVPGIELQLYVIESDNSIGTGERNHAPFRQNLRILGSRFPSLNTKISFRNAIKALNGTIGPEGTISSMTVLCTLRTFPEGMGKNREQSSRMEAMETKRCEIEKIVAGLMVSAALRARLPPATKFNFSAGQRVRDYRETGRRWEGPFRITPIQGKPIWIPDGAKIKKFKCPQILPDPADLEDREMALHLEYLK